MAGRPDGTLRVEALTPEHDRKGFACGVPALGGYLREQASQDVKRHVAAVFVLPGEDSTVLGYYTLSQQIINLQDISEAVAGRLPRYPLLPATLVGRLAVDSEHQGEGLGSFLLMDALLRSWQAAQAVASYAVRVDATDERARDFYLAHEFIPFPKERLRLFMPMTTLDRLFAGDWGGT